ncbi:MAG: hypothetical protein RLZZ500_578 [Bacteroidota bacterium]|jgi:phosphohistidine phosphatase
MKFILSLVRHAKSSWDLPLEDKLRPLNEIGVSRAHRMKTLIQQELVHADFVFSSPAVRARTTAQICLEGLNFDAKAVLIAPELYTFEVQKLETFVKKIDSSLTHVFLFGHNSAITDFVNKFGDRYIENVPTSGWVTLEFETTSWNQIQRGKTIRFRSPSDL